MIGWFHSARERRLWILAAGWLLSIYASLGLARHVVDFLRGRGMLRPTVVSTFAAAALGVAWTAWRRRAGPWELGALAASGAVYATSLALLSRAEERLHFLEYGILAGLVLAALRERRSGATGVPVGYGGEAGIAFVALVATTLCGWGDEGIQALLPSRVYDLRDVAFNAAAALLMVSSLVARRIGREVDGLRARDERPVRQVAGGTGGPETDGRGRAGDEWRGEG